MPCYAVNMSKPTAVTYLRISLDPEDKQLGVDRQRAEVAEVADRYGMNVLHEYVDNSRSALRGHRPAFDELLERVAQGGVSYILAASAERLYKQTLDELRLADVCTRTGTELAYARSPWVNFRHAGSRGTSELLSVVSRMEGRQMGERMRLANRQKAMRGGVRGGGSRPFGLQPVYADDERRRFTLRWEEHPTEGPLVREIAERFAAGESLGSIAHDVRQRGFTGTGGGSFNGQSVRKILINPRLSGRVSYAPTIEGQVENRHAPIVAESEELPVLIDPAQQDIFRAKLISTVARPPGRPATYLLGGGLARCGVCGSPLIGSKNAGRRRMRCQASKWRDGNCSGVSVVADELEAEVVDGMFRLLLSAPEEFWQDVRADLLEDAENPVPHEKVEELQQRRLEIADALAEGVVDAAGYQRAVQHIDEQISELLAVPQETPSMGKLAEIAEIGTEEGMRRRFEASTLHERREQVRAVFERVYVHRLEHHENRFQPERLQVELGPMGQFLVSIAEEAPITQVDKDG